VDIPIEIPARDSVAPLAMPPARSTAPRAAGEVQGTPAAAASAAKPAPPQAAEPVQAKVEPAPAKAEPAPAKAEAAAPKAEPAPPAADAQRAQALLEGKGDDAPAKVPRFVVQAGAYSDAASLREARQKVEKLGLKTYTQVVTTDAGPRTRVRVGPFATRDEAEAAAARIKGSGLAVNILSI
jgi:DedD protein